MKRSSGILLPIFSLPSKYGIGTVGREAYKFVDFLSDAKQSWWQILPAGPTSYGDSPYQSFSSFAGNPYFVDLELLCEQGDLTEEECEQAFWGDNDELVDYSALYNSRFSLLKTASKRAWQRDGEKIEQFKQENKHWLSDYTLYMAIKRHFGMKAWYDWPDDGARLRIRGSLEQYREKLKEDIDLFTYIQYCFFSQWEALKSYANGKGIKIIGDLPIYVALDSADVWANNYCFLLDLKSRPTAVAGVPPDAFTDEGQLWGNPLYNWPNMALDGYKWWHSRIEASLRLYDAIRIDHFRGFESYWLVPADAETAKNGKWVKGPGFDFVSKLNEWFPQAQFLAEDLGILTDEVHELLEKSGLPGMCVLQFGFEPGVNSDYLPHNHRKNCVCYCGTHDNAPLLSWREEQSEEQLDFMSRYLGLNEKEGFTRGFIRAGMSSNCDLFIAQMQDYLNLSDGSRINLPGTSKGNWQWRMKADAAAKPLAEEIASLTELYFRA